jgi:hypothetical protein
MKRRFNKIFSWCNIKDSPIGKDSSGGSISGHGEGDIIGFRDFLCVVKIRQEDLSPKILKCPLPH